MVVENGFNLTQIEVPLKYLIVDRWDSDVSQAWTQGKDSRATSICMVIEAAGADDTIQGEYAE